MGPTGTGNPAGVTVTLLPPSHPAGAPPSGEPAPPLPRLRLANAALAALHAGQGAAVLALSNGFELDVTATFLDGPPGGGTDPSRLETLFPVALGPAVAVFLFLSALSHLLVATVAYRWYTTEVAARRNRLRWVEYSLSASLMIVLIAMVTGISDIAALVALFGVNAAMILFGWVMESVNRDRWPVWWTPFGFGCVAGVVPWVAITIYLVGPGGDVPDFVYGIFASLFVCFNCFALNQWLQYRRVGRWRDWIVGEWVYAVLSLTAKSALAWQVFANVLVS